MIFSTTSTVRKCGWPVNGHGTSSVRRVTFSSTIFCVSRTIHAPGLDLIAMRGNLICCQFEHNIFLNKKIMYVSNYYLHNLKKNMDLNKNIYKT